MKRIVFLLILVCSLVANAQRKVEPPVVSIVVGDSAYEISSATTQTEVKKGWKIFGFDTKLQKTRYLWGKSSRQREDSHYPTFIIRPGNYSLNDFAIIELKKYKEYRSFESADWDKCTKHRIDLDFMKIELVDDEHYRVTPLDPLSKGEYVIVNLKSKVTSEQEDRAVYPFTIKPPER